MNQEALKELFKQFMVTTVPIRVKAYRPYKDLPLVYTKDAQGNAGYDLYATDTYTLAPHDILKVPVNAHFRMPTGYFGFVVPRSGLSLEGVNVIPGTIDSSYTGQISAIVQNASGKSYEIERGLRVAQIIFIKHEFPEFEEVDSILELGETERGMNGFGDSGYF